MEKEAVLWCVLVALCLQAVVAEKRKPAVQVYTRYPVEVGKENILQCYVSRFHPPKIDIELMKNDEPIASQRSDLSFDSNWAFHQLVHANITMEDKTAYSCRVQHETFDQPKTVQLEIEF